MKNDVIEEFLSNYSSERTRHSYKFRLKEYFDYIKENPNTYIRKGRNYEKDIEKFWKVHSLRPPKTRNQTLSAVRMFLEENDIEIKNKFWKKLRGRAKGKRALTQDKVPTNEELKEILHQGNINNRAFFLTLATSGMRVNEALHLSISDIELDKTPARINIPGKITKSGEPRITFITNETRDAVRAWLKKRDKYLLSVGNRFTGDRCEDERLFPYIYQTAWVMWRNLIRNAGKNVRDGTTNRYKFHIHSLRKFFRSRLPKTIGVDMTEYLMGHENYLSREYRHYTVEELGKEYLKGAERLLVFETPADTTDLHERLDTKDKQLEEMQKTMEEMKAQILELRLDKLEKANGIKKK